MSNHEQTYKPLPSFEDKLLEDVPAGWIQHGTRQVDPLTDGPHPSYKPHYPKGKCQACGSDYERKSNRQQYCPDCQPVVSKQRKAARNRRQGLTRAHLGVVPFRATPFVIETRNFIWELKSRYGDKAQYNPDRAQQRTDVVRHDEVSGDKVVYTTGFGSHLSGQWKGVWSEGVFEDKSGRTIPKGIKPELAINRCECGGRLHIELPRGRATGGKIGAKELVCSECGLVAARGVRSYPEESVDDYRCGRSGQSW